MSNIGLLGIQGYLPAQDLGFKGAYGLQRWKEPRSDLCPASVLPGDGNLHTLQGSHPGTGGGYNTHG